jgi:alpha-beta hydrolase superfamily lysophospholipase
MASLLPSSSDGMRPALIWVHGIFGSPREYAKILPLFQAMGYECYCVTLPAHGPTPTQTFVDIGPEEFVTHVLSEVERVRQDTGRPVVLIGHSLGGILSLTAAGYAPEGLVGVVALAAAYDQAHLLTPHWHLMPIKRLIRALRYIPDYWHGFERPQLPLGFIPRFRRHGYGLLGELQQRITGITVPVLLAHSPYDLSIPWEEQHKLYQCLKRADVPVTSVTLDQCGHQIFPLSKAQDQVVRLLSQFLASLQPQPADDLVGV